MRKGKKPKLPESADQAHQGKLTCNDQALRAANDNRRRRRTVLLLNFDKVPLRPEEIAVIDGLMQVAAAANDNSRPNSDVERD